MDGRTIYAIYDREDNDVMLQLLHHLKPLEKDFDVTIWHDDPIDPGQLWKPQIESRLDQTDIFLLLVSNAFMHSEFIKQLEFKMVIDRYKAGKAIVIPIIVDTCPWDIDFNSDDYDFNFKELQVLPEEGKPISDWKSFEQAYSNITAHVRTVISSFTENRNQTDSGEDLEKKTAKAKVDDPAEIGISAKTEGDRLVEEGTPSKEEIEDNREAEVQRLKEEAETKRMAEEALRRKEEVEAVAKRNTQEEKSRKEAAETKKMVEEDLRRREELEVMAKRSAQEEKRLKEAAEAKRLKEEEDNRFKEEVAIKSNSRPEPHPVLAPEVNGNVEETHWWKNTNYKKRIIFGSIVILLIVVGAWAFSLFESAAEKPLPAVPNIQEVDTKDSIALEKTKIDSPTKGESFSKLAVGDNYDGGIIFVIDHASKIGKIAHNKDAGPMPWKNAMKIQEQLGEGWRLPTLEELGTMYQTIGQGETNSGNFVDELYWSATAYDDYQARLLRFSDGNTSYHYNKSGEFRKFWVRAIRDFGQ